MQVSRLSALLEASKLQAALSTEQLMADLADERVRSERLRAVRDDALMQRWVGEAGLALQETQYLISGAQQMVCECCQTIGSAINFVHAVAMLHRGCMP